MMQTALSLALVLFCSLAQAISNADLKSLIVNVTTPYGELRTEIHFSQKDLLVAKKAEEIIKTDLTKAVRYFGYIPAETIHFNIDPYLRLTNGNATVFPTNIINLYNFPASNLEHLISLEDWLQGLMFHEFIHVMHLDQTRGYLQTGRNIFGSIAKIPPGLVPRWFTEGIAVWGESNFLAKGRLNNEMLNKDLWIMMNNKNSCSTLDCLDSPGTYPRGQLAYWAGGHFMNYLENKKAGTIKCLVTENSKRIPFFLNGAFEECTGKIASELFFEFRNEYLKKYSFPSEENAFGATDSQKGQAQIDEVILKVESTKNKSALVRYDQKVSSYRIFSEPIDHVGDVVQLDNENKAVIVAFNDDPQFVQNNKIWKLINVDTLLEESPLNFSHDPSYVLPTGPNEYLTFSYEENHWRAYKVENKMESMIFEWPLKYNLIAATKKYDKILLKINTANEGTYTYSAEKDLKKILKDGKVFAFKNDEKVSNTSPLNYPRLEHLKPYYWFLAAGNSNTPGSIGAMTSVADPMNVHSGALTGLVYPSISKMGGTIDYVHTDHLWKQYFFLTRDYSINSWSSIVNKADEGFIGTSYRFELKKWMYIPQFNLGLTSSKDAISNQQTRSWSILQWLNYQALSQNDFWQNFLFSVEGGSVSPSSGTDYFKLQTKMNLSANIKEDYSILFKSSYGKLYKKTFSNGVLYGGGLDQIQLLRRYEFYGLPYGDAYGNEIFANRITNDFNLKNIYRGKSFIPIFLKEIHGVIGFENLAADRIYIDRTFYRNENIYSWFFGTKLLTNIFYYVPVNINLIYAVTTTPLGRKINSFNFNLNLEM